MKTEAMKAEWNGLEEAHKVVKLVEGFAWADNYSIHKALKPTHAALLAAYAAGQTEEREACAKTTEEFRCGDDPIVQQSVRRCCSALDCVAKLIRARTVRELG